MPSIHNCIVLFTFSKIYLMIQNEASMKIHLMIIVFFLFFSCKQKIHIDLVNFEMKDNSPGLKEGRFQILDVKKNELPRSDANMIGLALQWLAENQENDGYWDTGKFGGCGDQEANLATTAMALYAFYYAGYDYKISKFSDNINRAKLWIQKQQLPNGRFGTYVHTNAICVFALSEAANMSNSDKDLVNSVRLGLHYLVQQQNKSGGFSYAGKNFKLEDDMVTIGLCTMAFRSVLETNIDRPTCKKVLKKILKCLEQTKYTNDNTETSKGESWYLAKGIQGTGKAGGACQAIAMCIRQKCGWNRSEPWMMAAANSQAMNLPIEYKGMDVFRVLVSFDALFQIGGENFKKWYSPVKNIILNAQRQDPGFKGSWDPTGCSLNYGGRVLYTAVLSTFHYRSYRGLH